MFIYQLSDCILDTLDGIHESLQIKISQFLYYKRSQWW